MVQGLAVKIRRQVQHQHGAAGECMEPAALDSSSTRGSMEGPPRAGQRPVGTVAKEPHAGEQQYASAGPASHPLPTQHMPDEPGSPSLEESKRPCLMHQDNSPTSTSTSSAGGHAGALTAEESWDLQEQVEHEAVAMAGEEAVFAEQVQRSCQHQQQQQEAAQPAQQEHAGQSRAPPAQGPQQLPTQQEHERATQWASGQGQQQLSMGQSEQTRGASDAPLFAAIEQLAAGGMKAVPAGPEPAAGPRSVDAAAQAAPSHTGVHPRPEFKGHPHRSESEGWQNVEQGLEEGQSREQGAGQHGLGEVEEGQVAQPAPGVHLVCSKCGHPNALEQLQLQQKGKGEAGHGSIFSLRGLRELIPFLGSGDAEDKKWGKPQTVKELQRTVSRAEDGKRKAEGERDQLRRELGDARSSVRRMEAEACKLKDQLSSAQSQLQQARKEAEEGKQSAQDAAVLRQRVERLVKEVDQLTGQAKSTASQLQAAKAKAQQAEGRSAALQADLELLEERYSEAQAREDALGLEVAQAQEELRSAQAALAAASTAAASPDGSGTAAGSASRPGGAAASAAPAASSSFEVGFGTSEQKALLDSLALQMEQLVAHLLSLPADQTAHQVLLQFAAPMLEQGSTAGQLDLSKLGCTSCLELLHCQPSLARAAAQHGLMEVLIKHSFEYSKPWDIGQLMAMCPDCPARQQLVAQLFREWYCAAEAYGARHLYHTNTHAGPGSSQAFEAKVAAVHEYVRDLAEELVQCFGCAPSLTAPKSRHELKILSHTFLKARLLVGTLQGVRPGLQLVVTRQGDPWSPQCHEQPLHEHLSLLPPDSQRRPGLQVVDGATGAVVEVLVRQQVDVLVPAAPAQAVLPPPPAPTTPVAAPVATQAAAGAEAAAVVHGCVAADAAGSSAQEPPPAMCLPAAEPQPPAPPPPAETLHVAQASPTKANDTPAAVTSLATAGRARGDAQARSVSDQQPATAAAWQSVGMRKGADPAAAMQAPQHQQATRTGTSPSTERSWAGVASAAPAQHAHHGQGTVGRRVQSQPQLMHAGPRAGAGPGSGPRVRVAAQPSWGKGRDHTQGSAHAEPAGPMDVDVLDGDVEMASNCC